MEIKKYLTYLVELNKLLSSIKSEKDLSKQAYLIEDYNRMLVHLLSSNKYFIINSNLEACGSNYYNNVCNEIKDKFINDFNSNKDLFINMAKNSLFSFFDASYNYGKLNSLSSYDNISVNECFKDFVNINKDVLSSYNLVKDRISIDGSYCMPGLMGHSVCLDNYKPCISVKKGNNLRNKYVISHELGHIFDYYKVGNKRLVNNFDFLGECYSILFELMFVNLLKEYDINASKSLEYLSGDSYFKLCYNQQAMYMYDKLIGSVPIDKNGNFVPKGNVLVDVMNKFDLSGVSLSSYQYIIGYALASSFISSGYSFDKIIDEYKKFVKDNDFIGVINNIDYKNMTKYIKSI